MNGFLKNMTSELIEQLNYFGEFKGWYHQIANDFKFDYNKDCEARDILSKILLRKGAEWNLNQILNLFNSHISEKRVIFIYGCGPTLEETTEFLLKKLGLAFFEKTLNIAADGASVFLREMRIPIDAIFTDLDGITGDEFNYSLFNIVHAHGDNIEKLKYFEENIINFDNTIATAQVEPAVNVINPGGFTDGDRIVFFLRSLLRPFQKLYMIGMDFSNIIGKYSKPEMLVQKKGTEIKIKKLNYAVQLLDWILDLIENKIYFLNSNRISEKFTYLSLEDFSENPPY